MTDKGVAIKWSAYIPHDPTKNVKQLAFLMCDALEALYGGAAGGGKSDALLMAALQYVDVPGYSAIIFRRTYPELAKPDGLIPRSKEWLGPTDATYNEAQRKWTFPSGAVLEFGHLQRMNDVYQYHSAQYQFIGFDELTTFEEMMYRYMFSRLRRLEDSIVPLRMRAGSNPGGIGHDWVLTRFIDPGSEDRVFIPANLDDNPFLDKASYEKSLEELDPITRLQLRRGDWSARRSGAMFQREWFPIVPEAPAGRRRLRYWDMAATEKKKGKDPDYTVGALLALVDGKWYLEDVRRVRATPGRVEDLIKQTATLDTVQTPVRMEQEPGSSGVVVIDHYHRKVLVGYDFKGNKSTGDKLERARPFASAAEAGNFFLVSGSWNAAFLDELEQIPFGPHDDQMDAVSGAMQMMKPSIGFAEFNKDSGEASGLSRRDREKAEHSPLMEVY